MTCQSAAPDTWETGRLQATPPKVSGDWPRLQAKAFARLLRATQTEARTCWGGADRGAAAWLTSITRLRPTYFS